MDEMEGGVGVGVGDHHQHHGHHTLSKEKEVSFANHLKNGNGITSSSPPTPSRTAGYLYPMPTDDGFHHHPTIIQNNESYPCDCCRLEDQYYPNPMLHSQRRHQVRQIFFSLERCHLFNRSRAFSKSLQLLQSTKTISSKIHCIT